MTFSGTIKRTFLLLIAVAGVLPAFSQRADSIRSARVDSIYNSLNDTATWRQELDFVNSLNWTEASDSDLVRPQTAEKKRSRMTWKQKEEQALMEMRSKADAWEPDPRKAVWMSLVFPGGGQIYNRKYWKLPVVYGGYVGCLYALTWNQNTYTEYRKAYVDIMDNDPETKSYEDFLPPHYEIDTSMEDWLKDIFKQRKDKYPNRVRIPYSLYGFSLQRPLTPLRDGLRYRLRVVRSRHGRAYGHLCAGGRLYGHCSQ